jgi:tRNA(fMet)-specific endonuclease VapC
MRYLLDTNICIYIINDKPHHVLERFQLEDPDSIGLSSVSAAELAYGVAKSGSTKNQRALEMFLTALTILPFDEQAIWEYGRVRCELERIGQPIGGLDTMIAAHAISLEATLVTNNTREFARVRGLRLENWS